MFIDNGLASGMGLDFGWPQRCAYFYGRVIVLSILAFLFYPFLWAWTIIGTLWFSNTKTCLSRGGQKWSFLIWLVFSYCGLLCIACVALGKWLKRRQIHVLNATESIHISAFGKDAIESSIQELATFTINVVPTNCNECLICLEEFCVGNQVRGLPCSHNFHVECIDVWLRLNVSCPRCRCSVFPNLDLNALSDIPYDDVELLGKARMRAIKYSCRKGAQLSQGGKNGIPMKSSLYLQELIVELLMKFEERSPVEDFSMLKSVRATQIIKYTSIKVNKRIE
ncbi:hypothetical protein PHAVU_009G179400 [Phaseolus vulgaris]